MYLQIPKRIRSSGFTVIELIIAVAILGIISTIAITNYGQSKTRVRDANRVASLKEYEGGMELKNASQGNYWVYRPGKDKKEDLYPLVSFEASTGRLTVLKTDDLNAHFTEMVGYNGAGWGRVTTKNAPSSHYPMPYSIADALLQGGFISQIKLDPRATDFEHPTGDDTHPELFNDFVLTLCRADGSPAQTPSQAVVYGLFANLENQSLYSSDATESQHYCGGGSSGHPWNTLAFTPNHS
jgi:prepilin-type N-terminal cleavage/methylation domain-containing protein